MFPHCLIDPQKCVKVPCCFMISRPNWPLITCQKGKESLCLSLIHIPVVQKNHFTDQFHLLLVFSLEPIVISFSPPPAQTPATFAVITLQNLAAHSLLLYKGKN